MQAGQDFGIVVVVQTDAAHQELLVYLPHHGTAATVALVLGHDRLHSWEEPDSWPPLNLDKKTRAAQHSQTEIGTENLYCKSECNKHSRTYTLKHTQTHKHRHRAIDFTKGPSR